VLLGEISLDSDHDGGDGKLPFEKACCTLSSQDTVGFACVVCEDDHSRFRLWTKERTES